MSDFEDLKLNEPFIMGIKNLVDGNQAKESDVREISHKLYDFTSSLKITWSFDASYDEQKEAGGKKASTNFNSKEAFNQHTNHLLQQARYDEYSREDFLNSLRNNEAYAIALADYTQNLYTFESFSLYEGCHNCQETGKIQCHTCRGKGKTTCPTCSGSGRNTCSYCNGMGRKQEWKTEYRSNGDSQTTSVSVFCNMCGGSGKKTCSNCGGSGKLRCSNCGGKGELSCSHCNGCGYFITTRTVSAFASPEHFINVDSTEYAENLNNFLSHQKLNFIAEHLPYKQSNEEKGESTHDFYYNAAHTITELNFSVFDKNYTANPPFAFIRPFIFDDLFSDELKKLQDMDADKKITHKEAFDFFSHYTNQPVLDLAFKSIAKIRTNANDKLAYVVKESCDYYISDKSALSLSELMKKTLDKISPVYSPWTWYGLGAILWVLLSIIAYGYFEINFKQHYIITTIVAFIGLLIFCGISGLVLWAISSLVTMFRRRKVPLEYRQKMRNSEAFSQFNKISTIFLILGAMLGIFTTYEYLPKTNFFDNFQLQIKQKINSDTKLETNQTEIKLSQKDKILYIQKAIGVKADGIFGSKTLKKHKNLQIPIQIILMKFMS